MKKRLALYISKEKKGERSEKLLLNCRYRDPTLERITRRIRVFLNRFREKVYILPFFKRKFIVPLERVLPERIYLPLPT